MQDQLAEINDTYESLTSSPVGEPSDFMDRWKNCVSSGCEFHSICCKQDCYAAEAHSGVEPSVAPAAAGAVTDQNCHSEKQGSHQNNKWPPQDDPSRPLLDSAQKIFSLGYRVQGFLFRKK